MQFPADFTAREQALLGPRFAELYAYATPQPARGVTVNGLRCTPEWFAAHADFAAALSPFCPTAFTTAPDFKPGRHPWHHAGVFYAQEPSASAPAALLDVHPGMKVADLCAAPGGKTSQLAEALQGQGLLLANEFVAARAEILRQNLERMGVTNAVITNEDTANLAKALPGVFDRVLVDAPCSGEGMFRKEEAAVTDWSEATVAMCAARLGDPERAVEYLLDYPAFDFDPHGLVGGGRAPFPYFPGNGGLLYAVAMMAAGWDGAPAGDAPGFPEKGWVVRSEGLRRAL